MFDTWLLWLSFGLAGLKEMKINCLNCGHKVDLDESYEDYEGLIKCFSCKAVLEIKIEEGKIKSVKIAETEPPLSVQHAL